MAPTHNAPMPVQWEYLTVAFRVVTVRERRSPYFSHRALQVDLDDEGQKTLAALGRDGWELVGVAPTLLSPTGPSGGVLAFFKRRVAPSPTENPGPSAPESPHGPSP